ncbi:hypothetical protein SLNWT_6132 [Streptomyces albus]|uniref:Uncharacterized protein n=1 Tax=Streptomyces albus (strain ATCC 21838 / DSM 41398 / FERM P-419 / JCM 4703 / NBRC 107858) TaxID=1081613 RepID=A0A0B5EUI6_STRA4|nr:hypothetical protein SLNWT_6132 [Streptomyces albus]AOU80812.1 hypothetical protein SLNHY_6121 [Streptomyces albus]AYN36516.1 hypothetical protein DUI70_6023 [Streptomyces albus]
MSRQSTREIRTAEWRTSHRPRGSRRRGSPGGACSRASPARRGGPRGTGRNPPGPLARPAGGRGENSRKYTGERREYGPRKVVP